MTAKKPSALKKLQGNPGKRALKPELKPTITRGSKVIVKDDNLATGFLDKYRPALQALGILTDVDEPAFEMAARHYSLAVQAYEQIKAEGLTVQGDHRETRKHPLLQVFRDNSQSFKGYAADFGMTPTGRSDLKSAEVEQLSLYERELEKEFFGPKTRTIGDKIAKPTQYDD